MTAPDVPDLLADLSGLVAFARGGRVPDGFAWLDVQGRPDPTRPVELWITCRTTHVAALATLLGLAEATDLVDHGLAALTSALHDDVHGGWYAAVPATPATSAGTPGDDTRAGADKEAYGHAFVVLAAASAVALGRPGARALLDEALGIVDRRFWVESDAMAVDRWDETFTDLDPYRGVNANMHLVEALLAAHDVTGDPVLLDRAHRITSRVVQGFGRAASYRLPEHYDPGWRAQPDLNRDRPADLFRPYGVTVGHLFEWARLAVHVGRAAGPQVLADLLPDARALHDRAAADGWAADGAPGFVYTTDFEGAPVVRERLHWVVAEALGSATVLAQETGDPRYGADHATWTGWAQAHVVDRVHGSWWHELDPAGAPAFSMWPGKPDVYHAFQALLLPLLPPCASFVGGAVALLGAGQSLRSRT